MQASSRNFSGSKGNTRGVTHLAGGIWRVGGSCGKDRKSITSVEWSGEQRCGGGLPIDPSARVQAWQNTGMQECEILTLEILAWRAAPARVGSRVLGWVQGARCEGVGCSPTWPNVVRRSSSMRVAACCAGCLSPTRFQQQQHWRY
jgi:hypothetical protein